MDGLVSAVQARKRLAEVVNRAAYGKERVILARRGKAVAAIVSLEDVELLEALEDRIDLENARAALTEAEKEGTVSWEEFKTELSPTLRMSPKMINSDQITDDVTLLSVAAKVHFIVSGQGRATRQEIMDLAKRLGGEISEKQVRQVVGYLERLELVAVDAS